MTFSSTFRGVVVVLLALSAPVRVLAECTSEYVYDAYGSVVTTFTHDGSGTTLAWSQTIYDDLGRQTAVISRATAGGGSNDMTRLYVYDVAGQVATQAVDADADLTVDATDFKSIYRYDDLGRQTKVLGPSTASGESDMPQVVYGYDLSGNQTLMQRKIDSGTTADTYSYYDDLNRVTKTEDPEGHYTTVEYDSRSLALTTRSYDSGDALLAESRNVYDGAGRTITSIRKLEAGGTGFSVSADLVMEYTYDDDGRVLVQTSYNMNTSTPRLTESAYDSLGRLTKVTNALGHYDESEYDDYGRVTLQTTADGTSSLATAMVYDGSGQMTLSIVLGNEPGSSDDLTTRYGYDCAGRRLSTIDPAGMTTSYSYDLLGRQTRMVEDTAGLQRPTDWFYDALGRLATQRGNDGTSNEDTVYGYDHAGRVAQVTYPTDVPSSAQDRILYVYDHAGRVISRGDQASGSSYLYMTYAYDLRGLVTIKSRSGGSFTETYDYDGLGRMITARKWDSSATAVSTSAYAYDDLSRVTLETQQLFGESARTSEYDYDQQGNRIEYIYPTAGTYNLTLTFAYDAINRPLEADRADGVTGRKPELITYEYQGREMTKRRVRTEYDEKAGSCTSDMWVDYEPDYDQHRRITAIGNTVRSGGHALEPVVAAYTYSYDAAGNRLTHDAVYNTATPAGFAKARDMAYDYDGLHRLTYTAHSDPSTAVSLGVEDFDYDLLGNRVTVTDTLNSVTRSYAHNLVNEYNKVTTGLSLPGSDNYFYDTRGNLSKDDGFDSDTDDGFVYGYDEENRLVQVDYDPGSGVTAMARYAYDHQGRRVETIQYDTTGSNPVTTRYMHDGPNMVAEYEYSSGGGATLARSYVHGLQYVDERAVLRDHDGSGQDHYYLLQELYSVVGLVGRNGALEEAYVYDSYGHAQVYAWPAADVNRDGVTNIVDSQAVQSKLFASCVPVMDVTNDGVVNIEDLSAVSGKWFQTAQLTTYSALGNPFMFTGRFTDVLHASDLLVSNDADFKRIQDNRNRSYDPKHGRWLQRDPIGVFPNNMGIVYVSRQYGDGLNVLEFVTSNPIMRGDPDGLQASVPGSCTNICVLRPGGRKGSGENANPGYCVASIPTDIATLKNGWTKQLRAEYVGYATCGMYNTCCNPSTTSPCRKQPSYIARRVRKGSLKHMPGDSWPTCCSLTAAIAIHNGVNPQQLALDTAKCRGGCSNNPCHAGGHFDPYCHLVKSADGSICYPKEVKDWDWFKDKLWFFKACNFGVNDKFVHCQPSTSEDGLCEGSCRTYCKSDKVPDKHKSECFDACREACKGEGLRVPRFTEPWPCPDW